MIKIFLDDAPHHILPHLAAVLRRKCPDLHFMIAADYVEPSPASPGRFAMVARHPVLPVTVQEASILGADVDVELELIHVSKLSNFTPMSVVDLIADKIQREQPVHVAPRSLEDLWTT